MREVTASGAGRATDARGTPRGRRSEARGSAVRAAAARAIHSVIHEGRSLETALAPVRALADPRDRALAQEIAFGVTRWYRLLAVFADRLLTKPASALDPYVLALLLVGMYQLEYTRVPPHAAVAATVAAAGDLGRQKAAGLANAVLRRFVREREALHASIVDESVRFAHPDWLVRRLRQAWPRHWQAILAANNEKPPMALRLNTRAVSRESYLEQLHAAGIGAAPSRYVSSGVILQRAVPVGALPGFAEGLVSVQDDAAQLAAMALAPEPGMRVLDACAAPGGKTGHLLEMAPGTDELVAVDVDAHRLDALRDTLDRLRVEATVVHADAAAPATWWDGNSFERILLDAPCTGTGVIRRHPDIKINRRAEDIPALQQRQAALLEAMWSMLARGGRLVYVTCSVLPEENEQQMQRFHERHRDARPLALPSGFGRQRALGRVRLPGIDGTDGFYYGCVVRE